MLTWRPQRAPFETTGLDFSEDASRLHPIRFPAAVQSKLGANHGFVDALSSWSFGMKTPCICKATLNV